MLKLFWMFENTTFPGAFVIACVATNKRIMYWVPHPIFYYCVRIIIICSSIICEIAADCCIDKIHCGMTAYRNLTFFVQFKSEYKFEERNWNQILNDLLVNLGAIKIIDRMNLDRTRRYYIIHIDKLWSSYSNFLYNIFLLHFLLHRYIAAWFLTLPKHFF